MSANDWTDERIALLRTLWTQGLTCAAIAKKLSALPGASLTRNAVIGKRVRIGLPDRAISTNAHRSGSAKPVTHVKRKLHAKAPKPDRAPVFGAPVHVEGDGRPRFIDRRPNQCAMFCAGEELSQGYVCGAPVERGVLCGSCYRLSYQPLPPRKAA